MLATLTKISEFERKKPSKEISQQEEATSSGGPEKNANISHTVEEDNFVQSRAATGANRKKYNCIFYFRKAFGKVLKGNFAVTVLKSTFKSCNNTFDDVGEEFRKHANTTTSY